MATRKKTKLSKLPISTWIILVAMIVIGIFVLSSVPGSPLAKFIAPAKPTGSYQHCDGTAPSCKNILNEKDCKAAGCTWFPTVQTLYANIKSGSGTLSSSPSGLYCYDRRGDTVYCAVEIVDKTYATITATPAAGYAFSSFICDYGCTCTVQGNTCTVYVDANIYNVNAYFKLANGQPCTSNNQCSSGVCCSSKCSSTCGGGGGGGGGGKGGLLI